MTDETANAQMALKPLDDWNLIDVKPAEPMPVVYFHAGLTWTDIDGNPVSLGPVRDAAEQCSLGYWNGAMWCDAGTGHDTFEPWQDTADLPTHWAPLRVPAIARATGAAR
jgi:hypothetical protein